MVSLSSMGAGQAGNYFKQEDYLLKGNGEWFGKGAEALGLNGQVQEADWLSAINGMHPDTGEQLVGGGGKNHEHSAGIDLAFNAPKSVSILAMGDERVIEAHQNAVREVMQVIQDNYMGYRHTADGVTEKMQANNMVATLRDHGTNRNLDPHLHTHATILNMVQTQDGEWKAMDAKNHFSDRKDYAVYYHNALANNLKELGYETEVTDAKFLNFEVKGVSKEAIEKFSERTQDINQKKEELREQYPNASEAELGQIANKETRMTKTQAFEKACQETGLPTSTNSDYVVGERFINRMEEIGTDLNTEIKNAKDAGKAITEKQEVSLSDAISKAMTGLTQTESTFKEKDLINMTMRISEGNYDYKEIQQGIKEMQEGKSLVLLDNGTGARQDKVFTTSAMQAKEQFINDYVSKNNHSEKALYNREEATELVDKRMQQKAERGEPTLSENQKEFVVNALASESKIMLVQGFSGAGKTFAAKEFSDIAQEQGYEIVAMGPTAAASNELGKSLGVDSKTVDKFLLDQEKRLKLNEEPKQEKPLKNYKKFKSHKTLDDALKSTVLDIQQGLNGKDIDPLFKEHKSLDGAFKDLAKGIDKDIKERLDGHIHQDHKQIWIVDESSMLGTDKMARMTDLADKLGARIMLIGDRNQLQSVDAGRMFGILQDGNKDYVMQMTDIQRQKTEDMRDMAGKIRDIDKVGDALKVLEDKGNVKEITDRNERLNFVADKYLELGTDRTVITVGVNEDRHALNEAIHDKLRLAGKIDEREHTLTVRESKNIDAGSKHFASSYEDGDKITLNKKVGDLYSGSVGEIISRDTENNTITIKTHVKEKNPVLKLVREFKEVERTLDVSEIGNNVSIYREHEIKASVGDKIVMLKNDKGVGGGVANGDTGQITGINESGYITMIRDKDNAEIGFNINQYNHFDLGHALTTYKSQGQSHDYAINLTNANNTNYNDDYVAKTRAKLDTFVVTDNMNLMKHNIGIMQEKTSTLDYTPEKKELDYDKALHQVKQELPEQKIGGSGEVVKQEETQDKKLEETQDKKQEETELSKETKPEADKSDFPPEKDKEHKAEPEKPSEDKKLDYDKAMEKLEDNKSDERAASESKQAEQDNDKSDKSDDKSNDKSNDKDNGPELSM